MVARQGPSLPCSEARAVAATKEGSTELSLCARASQPLNEPLRKRRRGDGTRGLQGSEGWNKRAVEGWQHQKMNFFPLPCFVSLSTVSLFVSFVIASLIYRVCCLCSTSCFFPFFLPFFLPFFPPTSKSNGCPWSRRC